MTDIVATRSFKCTVRVRGHNQREVDEAFADIQRRINLAIPKNRLHMASGFTVRIHDSEVKSQ